MATAKSSSTPGAAEIVEIVAMGHAGDGVTADGRFVPGALPGERVALPDGRLLTRSPDRIAPPCVHFGACGGCTLQHWAAAPYRAWKRESVIAALSSRGLRDVAVAETHALPPAARRRAVFAAKRAGARLHLGFRAAAAHRIVDQTMCPVLVPELDAAREALRGLAEVLLPRNAGALMTVLASATGLDVAVACEGRRRDASADARARMADAAAAADLARLAVNGEVIAERRPPLLDIAGVRVAPPPGAFVQPSAAAEAVLRAEVAAAVGTAAHVVDLFAGLGTFALPLARAARVHAVEGDAALSGAMLRAARAALGLKPVTAETRNLFRRPLLHDELRRVEAAVIDPPRAGAMAQCEELAGSPVPRIAMVSCNPATFARDARILVDGGYRLARVVPVDQFLWSAHVELVAAFTR